MHICSHLTWQKHGVATKGSYKTVMQIGLACVRAPEFWLYLEAPVGIGPGLWLASLLTMLSSNVDCEAPADCMDWL